MFKTTATFCEVEVAVGCWVLSLSTNYRDFSAIASSAAPKKCAWVDSTSKTQGFGVGDRSRKMVLSRSLGAWSRFAHHCLYSSVMLPPLAYCFTKHAAPPGHTTPQLAAPPGQCGHGHASPPGYDVASLPAGYAASHGHDAIPHLQACCSPIHVTLQSSAKNRNLSIAPMDHYFVTKRVFLMGGV
jgi:hypothetical protein